MDLPQLARGHPEPRVDHFLHLPVPVVAPAEVLELRSLRGRGAELSLGWPAGHNTDHLGSLYAT